MSSLYPRSPANVPKDFTQSSARYRWEVTLVLVSLLLSLAFYLVLVIGSGWLCYKLITAPWPIHIYLRIIGVISSGLLSLYLVKGLFKGSQRDNALLVEITEADQPELFAFIRQICAETGAPFPYKVYLTPEVNAAVFYHSSFLSLILPTPKNLLIGLGLVNMLNLSEFKAVLAHEFGHFSQKSMKLGTYVYVANKVMADVIYGRDFLDDALRFARGLDIRIAIFVWIFMGMLWGFRKVLEWIFKAINIFNLSLNRQMEFNADRMAVSVAGSDAIVNSLLRAGFADQAFRQLSADLWSAADHRLYSADIFHHQIPAAEQLRRRAKIPQLGERPEGGAGISVFKPGEGELGTPLMWSTHPSNHDREKNAKEHYLSAETDDRSPWLLFHDLDAVRREVSQRYYDVMHRTEGKIEFADPAKVQKFLDEEYAETTYADRYHGFYDSRYLEIPELEPLFARWQNEPMSAAEAFVKLQTLFGPDMQTWVKGHWQRLDEHDLLAGVQAGRLQLRNSSLDFRGQAHPPSAVPTLLERVQKELNDDQAHKAGIDAEVLRIHRLLAYQQAPAVAEELVHRYRFHLGIQEMHRTVTQAAQETQAALNYASGRELTPEEFAEVRGMLRHASQKVFDLLDESARFRMPALKNMCAGESVREFLLQKSLVATLAADTQTINPEWIQRFMAQAGEIQDKLRRLLFKSMGGILALQEQIAQKETDGAASQKDS